MKRPPKSERAEAREVERRQHGVALRAVAERRRPGVLASVEVDRDDAAEGRLEERQTPGAEEPLEAPDVAMRDGTAGRRLAYLIVEQELERQRSLPQSKAGPRNH